jgi:hypothetical protein
MSPPSNALAPSINREEYDARRSMCSDGMPVLSPITRVSFEGVGRQ